MIQFEEILYSVSEFSDTKLNNYNEIEREQAGKLFKFSDICPQVTFTADDKAPFTKCYTEQMPLDFIYEVDSNSYRLDLYDTDEKLVTKFQTGKGDPHRYPG